MDISEIYGQEYKEPEDCKDITVEEIIAMYNVDKATLG